MKYSLFCLLIFAVLAACSGEAKDQKVAETPEDSTESITLVEVVPQADTLQVDIQQKANEIDVLLEGI